MLIIATVSLCTLYAQKKPVQPSRKLTHVNQTSNQDNQPNDTVPVVRAMDKMKHDPIVKIPLVYSIPAEEFRPSNINGNIGYYKIRREDGLGTLAGTGETINNTLVAPIHLPDGAVIEKMIFHVLSLRPSGPNSGVNSWFPHFRLVTRGIVRTDRQKGAYMSILPLTYYSATSPAISNRSGLVDVQSISSKEIGHTINNKNAAYYIEILANKDDRPPVDGRGSNWPNDNYLFIWSVEVYYSMK